ncbi:MAG: family acetyltransferase [Paenibacillus sp.]|nr:family acetyltransferase [Paenibacillus sp.]
MIKNIDITEPKMANDVLKVQIPSYQVEAKIIDYYDIPPLEDTVETLQACNEIFFGYYIHEELCGAIAIKIEKNVIDIHRLIVSPKHFRKGIANSLLAFIENNYQDIKTIIVSTGAKNVPAVNFYLKNGFTKIGEIRVNERLTLASFQKNL